MGNPGIRNVWASKLPSLANSSVQILMVAIPRFSNSTASWIHHDMQEPQSPIARRARSHFAAISSNISVGAADAPESFSFMKISIKENSRWSAFPTSRNKRSPFGLWFQRSPRAFPWRSKGLSAISISSVFVSPTGTRISIEHPFFDSLIFLYRRGFYFSMILLSLNRFLFLSPSLFILLAVADGRFLLRVVVFRPLRTGELPLFLRGAAGNPRTLSWKRRGRR